MYMKLPMPGTLGGAKIIFSQSMKLNLPKIGIVGLGFVGGAIKESMTFSDHELVIVDPAKGYTNTYQDLADCDGVFVCVPSPQGDDGSCDTSILESVLPVSYTHLTLPTIYSV